MFAIVSMPISAALPRCGACSQKPQWTSGGYKHLAIHGDEGYDSGLGSWRTRGVGQGAAADKEGWRRCSRNSSVRSAPLPLTAIEDRGLFLFYQRV